MPISYIGKKNILRSYGSRSLQKVITIFIIFSNSASLDPEPDPGELNQRIFMQSGSETLLFLQLKIQHEQSRNQYIIN
jgi:hypothetical protein